MDTVQLEHFLSLAETGNISKSADLLFISRQGLSKSISMLEKELGVSLFLRTNSGVTLSEGGRIFFPVAQSMFQSYHSVSTRLRQSTLARNTSVRIAFFHGFFANISTDMVDSFFDANPHLEYFSTSYIDDQLLSQFKQGDFDFAITTDTVRYSEFEYYPLFRNYRCISVHSQHPLAQKDRIRTRDLQDYPLVCNGPGFFDYNFITRICNKAGFRPNLLQFQDPLTIVQYAQTGRTPTLMMPNISNPVPQNQDVRFLFWDEEELNDTVVEAHVVIQKDKRPGPDARRLIRHMQKYCQQQIASHNTYPWTAHHK